MRPAGFASCWPRSGRSANLYDGLAEAARGERREILNQLAAVERRHAEHWAGKLVEKYH